MKKMNRKGFTLVELLAVIVILAILMAIAATNIGPVIDNSRRSSMRTTAKNLVEAVRIQLTSNYRLDAGKYAFTRTVLDSGGITAPFGGEYAYYTGSTGRVANSSVYKVGDVATSSPSDCASSTYSYVVIKRTEQAYIWSICLTTKKASGGTSPEGGYLYGSREQLDDEKNTGIFYGKAKLAG